MDCPDLESRGESLEKLHAIAKELAYVLQEGASLKVIGSVFRS